MLEILATLVLYICEIRAVRKNLEKEKESSDLFEIRAVRKNHGEEKKSSDLFSFFAGRGHGEDTAGRRTLQDPVEEFCPRFSGRIAIFFKTGGSKNPAGSEGTSESRRREESIRVLRHPRGSSEPRGEEELIRVLRLLLHFDLMKDPPSRRTLRVQEKDAVLLLPQV
jgi:hypothetical protein